MTVTASYTKKLTDPQRALSRPVVVIRHDLLHDIGSAAATDPPGTPRHGSAGSRGLKRHHCGERRGDVWLKRD